MPILDVIIARLAFVYVDKIIFSCNNKLYFLLTITLIFCSTAARWVINNLITIYKALQLNICRAFTFS